MDCFLVAGKLNRFMEELSKRQHKIAKPKKPWRKNESIKSVEETDSRCSSGEGPQWPFSKPLSKPMQLLD